MAQRPSAAPAGSKELTTAIATARANPEVAAHWDKLEALADASQSPNEVAAALREVLQDIRDPELVTELGQRALRFHEAWFGEDSAELPALLERVLVVDPQAEWAFQRLTVAYTVAERWADLLALYDRAIEGADSTAKRMQLLDEAAHVAKDFAGEPDRAIGYLLALFKLEPSKSSLASSLERLLERQGRHRDLAELWLARVAVVSPDEGRKLREQVADLALAQLQDAELAIAQIDALLATDADHKQGLVLLERVLGQANLDAVHRERAFVQLKETHLRRKKKDDVIRVLEARLEFAAGDARLATLRELVERLTAQGKDARAMDVQATLLLHDASAESQETMRQLAERTRRFDQYANAFVQAAERCERPNDAAGLLLEAARTHADQLQQIPAAIDLYRRVLQLQSSPETNLRAARRLAKLLDGPERAAERLQVLEQLCVLEPEDTDQQRALGQLAKLAEQQGDRARAISAWEERLRLDERDAEAMDALIAAYTAQEMWPELIAMLSRRAELFGASPRRRADLTVVARVQAEHLGDTDSAIDTWRTIVREFGDDAESARALIDLLGRAARWPELADVLRGAAGRETATFTDLHVRLGDAYRHHLGDPRGATLGYRSALQADPACAEARAGLTALLDDVTCRATAIEALTQAYRDTDEWERIVDLTEVRVQASSDPVLQAAMLVESAKLHERRGAQADAALTLYRRAFSLVPSDRSLESEIRRLAQQLDAWDVVAATYAETLEAVAPDSARAAELRFEQGTVLESRLKDLPRALDAYGAAARIAPHQLGFCESAVRLAAQLGDWSRATGILFDHTVTTTRIEPLLVDALSSAAAASSQWPTLAAALADVIARDSGLAPTVLRQLHVLAATWFRDQASDPTRAEASLVRALSCGPDTEELLRALAALQRRAADRPLVDTLLRLSALTPSNLDPLHEALVTVRDSLSDNDLLETVATQLRERASDALRQRTTLQGEIAADRALLDAVDCLSPLYAQAGRADRAVECWASAARLVDGDRSRTLLHRAATIAYESKLIDAATDLYRQIVERDARDALALSRLAEMHRAADRLPELLEARRRQLSLVTDADERLSVRIEIAELLAEIEARAGRVQLLRDNLDEHPGHASTLAALTKLLLSQRDVPQLVTILSEQASRLEANQNPAGAAALYRQVAELAETKLRDVAGAITAYRRLFALDAQGDAADALARLHAAKGDHAGAAEWLEKRLLSVPAAERVPVALRLARAQLTAGEPTRAQEYLERVLAENASALEVRTLLASIYRSGSQWAPLASLLAETADLLPEPAERLACLREAIDLWVQRLDDPARAVSSLERAVELAPDDRDLQLALARGLTSVGRYSQARDVLQGVISGFGRKRTPERAAVHYELAKVARAEGDVEAAFEQLETAAKMDLAHSGAQHMLGELARAQGDHDRAERAFRGLLMMLRRTAPDDIRGVGPSETLYELYEIARARGDAAQADELLESALETALQHGAEAVRFQEALRTRGEHGLLLRLIDGRLQATHEPSVEARILADRAAALHALAREDEAMVALLRATELDAESDEIVRAARKLAVATGQQPRLVEVLTRLADTAARAGTPQSRATAARLLLTLGEMIEEDTGDLDRAAAIYAKVEALGERVVEVSLKLARVAGQRGNVAEQRRVLQHIVGADVPAEFASLATDAAYQLAELDLTRAETVDTGIAALRAALDRTPRYAVAKQLLDRAADVQLTVPLLDLYADVARASGDEAMLLRWHEHTVTLAQADLSTLRDGALLALRLGFPDRAEALLRAAAELASAADDRDLTVWIHTQLADVYLAKREVPKALESLSRAAEAAAPQSAAGLYERLAEAAGEEGGDLALAVRALQWLFENDSPSHYPRYLAALSRLGDRDAFDSRIAAVLDALLDPTDRNAARLVHARFLVEVAKAETDAMDVLKDLLNDDPDAVEGAQLLADLYERHGMDTDLADLLQRQFDRARDTEDRDQIAALGLRIGGLLASERPQDAMDVFRSSLDWVPENLSLLRALVALLDVEADAGERADLMQRMLPLLSGDEAIAHCEQLIDVWTRLDDMGRVEETLRLGYHAAPHHAPFRERLESWYAERSEWRPFAELMVAEAMRLSPSTESVARLKNAATLFRDELADTAASADALRKALEQVPDDLTLLGELARNLAASGQYQAAVDDVTRLLERHPESDSTRVDLLRIRADLYASLDDHDHTVVDLEAAYVIAPIEVSGLLMEALAIKKGRASADNDRDAERDATLRLVQVLAEAGSADVARDTLCEWADKEPTDREALRRLRDLDTASSRWDAVVQTAQRLIAIEEGDDLAAAALALVDACDNAGRSGDARPGLEAALVNLPGHPAITRALRDVYEKSGAYSELATLLLGDAAQTNDTAERMALLLRAAGLLLSSGDAVGALIPLMDAHASDPTSEPTMLLLIDAYTSLGRIEEALQMLEEAIAGHKKKRSPELARLQHRMARLAEATGDDASRYAWLNTAFETDRTSDTIAAELAEVAYGRQDFDTAMKALRVLSLMDEPVAMTKAMAFLRQAQVAHATGDTRRAGHWARKAKSLDATLHEAQAFLDEIGG